MSTCLDCSKEFVIPEDDLQFCKNIDVPPPRCCSQCRFIRRLTERNAKNLYKRKCDLTGKEFISPYHSDHVFPVYAPDVWWSDDWDPMEYGQEFNFNRPFFAQFEELLNRVPRQGQFICGGTLENSDYVNCAGYLKNCYLIAEADYNENCYYGNRLFHNLNLCDCSNCYEDESCYECIDCIKCHTLQHSQDCQSCYDSFFLKNCIACKDCIGCINQRQKQYMIFNEQLNKDEYEKRKTELVLNTYQGIQNMRKKADELFLKNPHKALQNEHNENSSGNYLYDSKNSFECFDCKDLEDCKYCARVFSSKTCMDYTAWGDKSELMYQCSTCGDNAHNLKFCSTCVTNNSDLLYCAAHCTSSTNCFGCAGIKKKNYCILNKQYSKEEYETLVPKIIEHMKEAGEWGEFFPKDHCPFSYNETIAMECFPLAKEEALAKGYKWRDTVDEPPDVEKKIPAEQLPQAIAEIPDDVLNWAVICEKTRRLFRIVQQELVFYRQFNIPLPHLHPDERHNNRIARRNPPILHTRQCENCGKDTETTYAPDRPEKVYCEECYLKEVY